MPSKFIWNLDMTIKLRTSKVVRFEVRASFRGEKYYVDARMSSREAYPIKICETIEEARIFVEELTEAVT